MIIASAIKLQNGNVFVGKRHNDCFANVIAIYVASGMDKELARRQHFNCVQGFINDKLEFLTRTQAYYEALGCNQCNEQKYNKEFHDKLENVGFGLKEEQWVPWLASEDLW